MGSRAVPPRLDPLPAADPDAIDRAGARREDPGIENSVATPLQERWIGRVEGKDGLVTGMLGGGVRAVLAGLWPVADRETVAWMWRFYRARLTGDLAAALTRTQRDSLAVE